MARSPPASARVNDSTVDRICASGEVSSLVRSISRYAPAATAAITTTTATSAAHHFLWLDFPGSEGGGPTRWGTACLDPACFEPACCGSILRGSTLRGPTGGGTTAGALFSAATALDGPDAVSRGGIRRGAAVGFAIGAAGSSAGGPAISSVLDLSALIFSVGSSSTAFGSAAVSSDPASCVFFARSIFSVVASASEGAFFFSSGMLLPRPPDTCKSGMSEISSAGSLSTVQVAGRERCGGVRTRFGDVGAQ